MENKREVLDDKCTREGLSVCNFRASEGPLSRTHIGMCGNYPRLGKKHPKR